MSGFALTLLQICIIIVTGRAVGLLLKRLGQPTVIGETAGGILLGPSAFGALAPDLFARVFPPQSIASLLSLSQIGLVLFMFLVGLEFAPELMRGKKHAVVVISHTSIIVPFLLGAGLAFYLYPRVADPHVTFRSFTLFLGIAMSITAFPVLARILAERNLTKTHIGNTAIACAAVDDVTAWCILAFVVMLARAGDPTQLAVQLVLIAVYVLVMIFIVRPLLKKVAPSRVTETALAAVLLLVLGSSWITEELGIHALFGAFLVGAIMPREGALNEAIIPHVRGVTSVLFLPLFFAVTGLRTNIGALQSAEMWICCALVLAVAIAGKLGGATLSAATVGFSWRESAAIGLLMNTRGLMEMVVVNIGLEIGVVSASLFTMIVIMALVTTAMTTPLLDLLVKLPDPAVEPHFTASRSS
jgi:Kef-type K+ transport system membrane component KefB